jgi:hypothetical protein
MEFHLNLDKFYLKFGKVDRESFVSANRVPILVFMAGGEAAGYRDFDAYAATASSGRPPVYGAIEKASLERIIVAPLAKSDRNEFSDKTLVGRSPVNDIVVPHPGVSKLHAFFEKETGSGRLLAFDGNSKFGTRVNGQSLGRGIGVPVKSGDALELAGAVTLHLFAPGNFYEYMMGMVRRKR